jgi:hypothetical protein
VKRSYGSLGPQGEAEASQLRRFGISSFVQG